MNRVAITAAVVAGACIANHGWAAAISVDLNGDNTTDFEMSPGTLSVFNGDTSRWTNGNLWIAHESLAADGIVTKRRVTFVVAETNDGLALMTLFDGYWDGGANRNWEIGFSSATSSDDGTWRAHNVEEAGMSFGPGAAQGTFNWREGTSPDAFAWTNLDVGDDAATTLEWDGGAGLLSNKPIQFITWDDDAEGGARWVRVGRYDFEDNGTFNMSFDVVPSPGALALLGIAGLLGWRRRR